MKLALKKTAACCTLLAGAILASLPLFFSDFLITYQFRPAVRPFYPLFYGAISLGGVAVIALSIAALAAKKEKKQPVLPRVIAALLGLGLLAVAFYAWQTTAYLAADKLYLIMLCGVCLGVLLCVGLVLYAILGGRFLGWVPAALAIMGGVVGAVLLLPPDSQAKPFPAWIEPVTLYKQGDAGYNTFKIPTMITAKDGTVLAFAEARTDSQQDWSKTDIVVRRSRDKGKTWEKMEVLFTEGNHVFGNACPVVDESTGYIWLVFCKDNDTVFITHSEDNGTSWVEPLEITQTVKLADWRWYATGPANGIQLADGTLMFPADHIVDRKMNAHVIFSKDHGKTWELGGSVPGGEEATLAQLEDGSIYMNVRPVAPGSRLTAISRDGGLTWEEIKHDEALPDPAVQGCLIKLVGNSLLFTNPADERHRENITVHLSEDGGNSWGYSRTLYEGLASYSALTVLEGGDNPLIGCAFECGANFYAEQIVFVSFDLGDITGG
jgi:sialidase-1